MIETGRREHKWSAARITAELASRGIVLNRRTVTGHLARLGLVRRRFIDPTGASNWPRAASPHAGRAIWSTWM